MRCTAATAFAGTTPTKNEPRQLDDWQPAFDALAADPTIHEVLLSGGDPLLLSDVRLFALIERLEAIPHLDRLRLHTRLPIVLPSRVTAALIDRLLQSRLTPIVVVHANHPAEIVGDCAEALTATRAVRHHDIESGGAAARGE